MGEEGRHQTLLGRQFCEYSLELRAAGTQEVMGERAGDKDPAGAMRSCRSGLQGAGARTPGCQGKGREVPDDLETMNFSDGNIPDAGDRNTQEGGGRYELGCGCWKFEGGAFSWKCRSGLL